MPAMQSRPFSFYNGKGLAIANPDNTIYNAN